MSEERFITQEDYQKQDFFDLCKVNLYNEIMAWLEMKVKDALDINKQQAYKYWIEEYLNQNSFKTHLDLSNVTSFDELPEFVEYDLNNFIYHGFLEENIIQSYLEHRKLKYYNAYETFYQKVYYDESCDVLNLAMLSFQYEEINKIAYNRYRESLIKEYKEHGIGKIKTQIDMGLISITLVDEEYSCIEKSAKEKVKIWEENLSITNYLFTLILQLEVLEKIKDTLENKFKTEQLNFKGFYPTIKESYPYPIVIEAEWQELVNEYNSPQNEHQNDHKRMKEKPLTISPIEWKGTQTQLAELFVELHKKGWIDLYDKQNRIHKDMVETIKQCFNKSNSIQQALKPTLNKDAEPKWDEIYLRTNYKAKFKNILNNKQ